MRFKAERAVLLARYIVETGSTVRCAAREFGIGKSTVHTDVTKKLRAVDSALWARCREVLERNRDERHLRGGDATKRKYARLRATRASEFFSR